MKVFSSFFWVFLVVSFSLLVFLSGCFQSPLPPQPSPPEITSLSPDRGCAGHKITITGKNFGETQGEGKVTFASCGSQSRVEAEVLSWSDTVIEVRVPSEACSGEVIVTVDGMDSNGVEFTMCICLPPQPSGPTNPVYNATQGKYYTTIQGAIDEANDGDEIVVYPGTYQENIDFKGKSIILRSTDPDHPQKTIIDGGGSGPVVTFSGSKARKAKAFFVSPTLRGFTIRNGSAEYGGGVYIEDSGSESNPVQISDNIISGNTADYCGGGIYVTSSTVTITGNTITENATTSDIDVDIEGTINTKGTGKQTDDNEVENVGGGGICVGESSSATITGNTITENVTTVVGGGIAVVNGAEANISENEISNNIAALFGGGICIFDGQATTISENTIEENGAVFAGGGIAVLDNSEAIIENNRIRDNEVSNIGAGGGICVTSSTGNITGNTITGNTAGSGGGGGVYIEDSGSESNPVQISGNTIRENTAVDGDGGGICVTSSTVTCCNDNTINSNDPDDLSGVTCDTAC